ncbi:RNA methyltransferase, TrmH family [Fodinibius roseus]|uniref:RNA methyltransferase, TrmH family n=1 Tax=Fodinibius roseus TaxID=1194090 RepID=A0A1M4Y9A9_9BACT|nr:RNA methyltransferase [Fodinibius roseus]SHF02186.1 RNA methyltransferase, TrmH family [Fodinibius roseus]
MDSVSNRQLTLLRKLNRKKYRYEKRLFLIEGARAVRQVAANNRIGIETLFFDEARQYWSEDEWKQLTRHIDSAVIDEEHFANVSDTANPQGVLAMCRMPDEQPVTEMGAGEGIIVALDAIQDPGNLGTMIRTASWFGAAGMLCGKGTVDLFHPKVVRSTAGATGTIPHINGELSKLLSAFEELGWSIILLNKSKKSVSLSMIDSRLKTIIVVGNEGHGIDSRLMRDGRLQAEIPATAPQPEVESLNAAVAASIALYRFSGT